MNSMHNEQHRDSILFENFSSNESPKSVSISSDFDERIFETTRQSMRDLIEEINLKKSFISFDEIFLEEQSRIGCILRLFNDQSEMIDGTKRISRERILKLFNDREIFNETYTSTNLIEDFPLLRRQMIKKKSYERKSKSFDLIGFMKILDFVEKRLKTNKDEILKKIIGTKLYDEVMKRKEIDDRKALKKKNIVTNDRLTLNPLEILNKRDEFDV